MYLTILLEKYLEQLDKDNAKEFALHEFSASSAGKCMRQNYYKKFIKVDRSERERKTFAIGNLFHEYLQKNILTEQQNEVSIRFDLGGPIIRARCDAVDKVLVWELKTVSTLQYVEDEPNAAHYAQCQLYLHIFERRKGKIVYINKNNFEMIEHDVVYDSEYVSKLLNEFRTLYDYIQAKQLPKKLDDAYDNFQCRYCKFKSKCKRDENV